MNSEQRKITEQQIKNFDEAIKRAKELGPPPGVDPVLHQAGIEGMESVMYELIVSLVSDAPSSP
jgi:hypothetical protein